MKSRYRLGILSVASPLEVGADTALSLREAIIGAFAAAEEFDLVPYPTPVMDPNASTQAGRYFADQRIDALVVVAASWFEDYLVLDLLEEVSVPVVLWSRPGMETGSLCGMQQLGYMLRELGRSYCVVFAEVGSPPALKRASDFVRAAGLRRELRRARLGFLGFRVQGMTETTGHELAMKKVFGSRIVGLDVPLFLERAGRVSRDEVAGQWSEVTRRVGRVNVSDEEGITSLQVYRALKGVVEEEGLAALAIGCYPHLMGKVCLGVSLLAEEGVPVGVEGDINGALGMLMLTRLTGEPVLSTDFLDPVAEHNSAVFAHCGCSGFSLAADQSQITLGPVRLMDRGLCCLFPARPGPCTLVNVVPTMGGYRLGVLYGEAVETTMVFRGNPLEVRFQSDYQEVLAWVADQGLGHHWMAGYGDLRATLRDLAGMVGCDLVTMA